MRSPCWQILIVSLLVLGCGSVYAQTDQVTRGNLTVLGRARSGTTNISLKKKRFYLFRGSREANKTLIDRLKAAKVTSRDCFYCGLKASPEFMDWLKQNDCESVHCREITQEDIAKVPEFQAAYKKGMPQFRKKPDLARKWLVTNLGPAYSSGFYNARKVFISDILKDLHPVQTAMTDISSNPPRGYFSNVSMSDKVEKFVFTNLVPIEIGEKSYIWICDIDVGKDKNTPILDTDPAKLSKKCEVIVRDLPVCKDGACEQK